MAAAEGNLRDVTLGYRQPFPPGQNFQAESNEAPATIRGSFLIGEEQETIVPSERFIHTDLTHNPAFASYMRMHKVFVGNRGSRQLETIYDTLKTETLPHYLSAAGWAAAEIALVRTGADKDDRLLMLDAAAATWERALATQTDLEYSGVEVEYGYMHRIALDLAVMPLFRGVVLGDVTKEACQKAFEDCLAVARSNVKHLKAAKASGNDEAVGCHTGVGYECNALLALNRKLSRTWFAVPAMARCDSGYYYRGQTHDLTVIHQKYGTIQSATPVEIKSKASLRDRRRYRALLVRGKMHLSVEGKERPEYTLNAIGAVYDNVATEEELMIADNATEQFTAMIRDYYAGEVLGKIASKHTVTTFRDNAQVIARHPGLSKMPILG